VVRAPEGPLKTLYPGEGFTKTFYPSILSSAFCLEDGDDQLELGEDANQLYSYVQGCECGAVSLTQLTPFQFDFAAINYASVLNIGTLSSLQTTYGLQDLSFAQIYAGIIWMDSTNSWMIPQAGSKTTPYNMVDMGKSNVSQLMNTYASGPNTRISVVDPCPNTFDPTIYLIRVADNAYTNSIAGTYLLVKAFVVGTEERNSSEPEPWYLRWDVVATSDPPENEQDKLTATAAVGVVFGVLSFIGVCVLIGVLIYQRKKGYSIVH